MGQVLAKVFFSAIAEKTSIAPNRDQSRIPNRTRHGERRAAAPGRSVAPPRNSGIALGEGLYAALHREAPECLASDGLVVARGEGLRTHRLAPGLTASYRPRAARKAHDGRPPLLTDRKHRFGLEAKRRLDRTRVFRCAAGRIQGKLFAQILRQPPAASAHAVMRLSPGLRACAARKRARHERRGDGTAGNARSNTSAGSASFGVSVRNLEAGWRAVLAIFTLAALLYPRSGCIQAAHSGHPRFMKFFASGRQGSTTSAACCATHRTLRLRCGLATT